MNKQKLGDVVAAGSGDSFTAIAAVVTAAKAFGNAVKAHDARRGRAGRVRGSPAGYRGRHCGDAYSSGA
ncbi:MULTISPECIES: hypothetical protein [Paraburkholderia]|uniref:hypothetical protein n=1 Tax=Paraburkholderia TaxID=1822464 RepID=UPI00039C634A|nr:MULTISPECIES: hypothetical protein [Paraburkholderia]